MSVFFGFLLVCHALQWGGKELFPAVLGVCTIHFLLKSADVFFLVDHGPLCLPTSLIFVFVAKKFLFDILERYLALLCRFFGIVGSRVIPFPGVVLFFLK